jgi:hypothetical protein
MIGKEKGGALTAWNLVAVRASRGRGRSAVKLWFQTGVLTTSGLFGKTSCGMKQKA